MIDIFDALRLAFDTGILTLIWIVQLIIYPGLTRYSESHLKAWHPIYTKRVTFIVLPLMLGQAAVSLYMVLDVPSWFDILHFLFVIIAWAVTFIKAVPLHGSLENEDGGIKVAKQLVQINKPRTALWTMTWMISVLALLV